MASRSGLHTKVLVVIFFDSAVAFSEQRHEKCQESKACKVHLKCNAGKNWNTSEQKWLVVHFFNFQSQFQLEKISNQNDFFPTNKDKDNVFVLNRPFSNCMGSSQKIWQNISGHIPQWEILDLPLLSIYQVLPGSALPVKEISSCKYHKETTKKRRKRNRFYSQCKSICQIKETW